MESKAFLPLSFGSQNQNVVSHQGRANYASLTVYPVSCQQVSWGGTEKGVRTQKLEVICGQESALLRRSSLISSTTFFLPGRVFLEGGRLLKDSSCWGRRVSFSVQRGSRWRTQSSCQHCQIARAGNMLDRYVLLISCRAGLRAGWQEGKDEWGGEGGKL